MARFVMTTDDLTEADELSTIELYEHVYIPLEAAVLALRPGDMSCALIFFASAQVAVSTYTRDDPAPPAVVDIGNKLSKPRASSERISILRSEGWLEIEEGPWFLGIQRVLFSSCLMIVTKDHEIRARMRGAMAPGLEAVREAYGAVLRRRYADLPRSVDFDPAANADDLFKD